MADAEQRISAPTFTGTIRLENVRQIQNLLKEFAPDLRRKMDRDVRRVIEPVTSRAKGLLPDTPLSRWHRGDRRGPSRFPGYDAGSARAGIRVSTGGRARGQSFSWTTVRGADTLFAYSILQGDAGGAVYEVAGRKNPGSRFGRNLTSRNGSASRGIWRAWDSMGANSATTSAILGVVTDTMREYGRRMEQGT